MKTKIFISSQWLRIDGVSASLISLLKELDYEKIDVDLFLTQKSGEWLSEVPPEVNVFSENRTVYKYSCDFHDKWANGFVKEYIFDKLILYCVAFWFRICRRMKVDLVAYEQVRYACWSLFFPRWLSGKEYDIAISFSGATSDFVRRVKAGKRFVWMHVDRAHHKPLVRLGYYLYRSADWVVNVSDAAKESFDRIFPKLRSKSVCIENVLSKRWLLERATPHYEDGYDGLRILSVGRLSKQKNYNRTLAAAAILKDRGVCFRWLIVGGGEEENALREEAIRLGVQSDVLFMGSVSNSAVYYPWCDVFVLSSDWEGKSVSAREAQIFCKPIVITRFGTASSQVKDGVDGVIAELTADSLADKIEMLASDKHLMNAMSSACSYCDYTNKSEIKKILSLGGVHVQ